jgi:fructose-bisphosphate aldolase class II
VLCATGFLVAAARAAGTGIAAFNVITIEHAEAVAGAAESTRRPAIVQISQNAVRYHGGVEALAAAVVSLANATTARLSLHIDHVDDFDLLKRTAACGASSVMFDASTRPDDENVAATKAAAQWAHDNGIWIEAELGAVGGKGLPHDPTTRTDPREAASFVAATGVDALAVAVGTSHAMLSRTARIDLALVSELRDAVAVPLVLHGSSGVALEVLATAIEHGITKVNVGTLLNVAFTGSVRSALQADPGLVDPRAYLSAARASVTQAVSECLEGITASVVPT